MARNVEIKARVADFAAVRARVKARASGPSEILEQTDTFFVVPRERLKIRQFADGSGELIAYERADRTGPKQSDYTRFLCHDVSALLDVLGRALPVRGVVKKRREVFIIGRTRVHLDDVERLGGFVELEVVLKDGELPEQGEREARDLLHQLAIPQGDLVAGAYIDLLEELGR